MLLRNRNYGGIQYLSSFSLVALTSEGKFQTSQKVLLPAQLRLTADETARQSWHRARHPPAKTYETHALSEALNAIDKTLDLAWIATFTSSGYTALIASGERPQAVVIAFTPNLKVYHRLNLIWGVKPILLEREMKTFEELSGQAETHLLQNNLAKPGDKILIMGGIPTQIAGGTNFLKIHTISD